jgi:hypothetical protein
MIAAMAHGSVAATAVSGRDPLPVLIDRPSSQQGDEWIDGGFARLLDMQVFTCILCSS